MTIKFRVCIPTAGIGSRVEKISREKNKSLISINYTAAISKIINKFPDKCEFVIPLGYMGNLVKQYLQLAHPKKKFYFVNIKKYKGKGSGLGLSLMLSKKYLMQPFIFISCDTIVDGKINYLPDHNWVGYSSNRLSKDYRKIEIDNKKNVNKFLEKNSKIQKNCKNYIGLAGIKNFKEFWESMEKNKKKSIQLGEIWGIKSLKNFKIKSYEFKWNDIGNEKSYINTLKKYSPLGLKKNILGKDNEDIWFNNNIVIKYFRDQNIVKKRIKRASILKKFIPKILGKKINMYSYKEFDGEVFSNINNTNIFKKLLIHIQKFHSKKDHSKNHALFQKKCLRFYKNKTLSRIGKFQKKFKVKDNTYSINGSVNINMTTLLKKINWKDISSGMIGRFHGDLHFENIIYSKKNKKFCFLDWRHDFENSLKFGDIYYDYAKIMHGILVSHEEIRKNNYTISISNKKVKIQIKSKNIYKKYLKLYNEWLINRDYDLKKIKILTGLIFLNISPLHHYPYSIFLYYFGKKILIEQLITKNFIKT